MKHEVANAKQTCCSLYHYFDDQEWDKARALLSDDFEVYWPQSPELTCGPDEFIEINRSISVERISKIQNYMCEYDQWDKDFTVSVQIVIKAKVPDGREAKILIVSFFELDRDGLITSLTEYRCKGLTPQQWRKELKEVF